MVKSDNNALWNVAVKRKPEGAAPEERPNKAVPEEKPNKTAPEEKPNKTMPEAPSERAMPEAEPKRTAPEAEPGRVLPKDAPKGAASDRENTQRGGGAGCLGIIGRILFFGIVGLVIVLVGACLVNIDSSSNEDTAQVADTGQSTAAVTGETASEQEKGANEDASREKQAAEGQEDTSRTEEVTDKEDKARAYRPLENFSKEGIIAAYEREGRPELAELARQYPEAFLKKECLELVVFDSPEEMGREYDRWNRARVERELAKGKGNAPGPR